MIPSSSAETIKSNKILENSLLTVFYHCPKDQSDFKTPFNFYVPNLSPKTNLSLNSSIYSNNSSSIKAKNNSSFNCINQYIKTVNKTINEQKEGKTFLGKKTKIYFNVQKNCKKKPFFITNKNMGNSTFDINIISQNNKSILKIENSNSRESTFLDKSGVQLEKELHKKEKPKLFYTVDYNLFENPEEESKNEGRWSYNENIKFIRAYVNFGKNYKLCQKYIGSRNKKQIISHAQKFFRKLKKLKNKDFDFSNDNIKDLSDIFKLIEAKNKNNIDKKEYIINTLISLCENIPKNENNYSNKEIKNSDKKRKNEIEDKADKNIECPSINNEKSIKRENDDELSKNIINTEDKIMFIFEKDEKSDDLINSNLDLKEDKISQKGLDPEEIGVNRGIDIEVNEKKRKNDIFVNEKNACSNYSYVDNNLNRSIKMYDDFIHSVGESDLSCLDDISSDVYKFLFVKNFESPFFNFTSNHLG